MADLKEKVLDTLKNGQMNEKLIDDIRQYQQNLLANHSNPAFSVADKNKILKYYTKLDELERTLGRYNRLYKNNYIIDLKNEEKEIENILNNWTGDDKYVWQSENSSNTCEICKALNGQEFDFYDEVPQRPHPNCKCKVKIVQGQGVKTPVEPKNTIRYQIAAPYNPFDAETQTWILPVPKGYKVSSQFGNRMHPVKKIIKFHDGIDVSAPMNVPVFAVADGVIVKAEWYNGYGNYIEIDHGDNLHSFYGHLNKILVTNGAKIVQGQNIGLVGDTGIGTGAHLHFGVHKNGNKVDPLDYLPSF